MLHLRTEIIKKEMQINHEIMQLQENLCKKIYWMNEREYATSITNIFFFFNMKKKPRHEESPGTDSNGDRHV